MYCSFFERLEHHPGKFQYTFSCHWQINILVSLQWHEHYFLCWSSKRLSCAKRANQNTWQCFVYPVPLIKTHAHQFKKIQCKISGVLYNKIFDFRFVFWSLVPDCITSFGKLVSFKPTAINHKSMTNKGNHTSNFTFPKQTQFYTKKGLSDQTREF